MSEFRHDPLTSTWTLISANRARRPQGPQISICPFCPGNECETPPEIPIPILPQTPDWFVRVFPNKYHVLEIEPQRERVEAGSYLKENGVGCHEVIVDHPYTDHRHPAELRPDEIELALRAVKWRMKDLVGDRRMVYPVFFKNHGPGAGSSLEHPHWQLIVLPIIPQQVRIRLQTCEEFFDKRRCCLLCQIIRQEQDSGERMVCEADEFLAWVPYTAQFPYELMCAPTVHNHRFEWTDNEMLYSFAHLFSNVMRRMREVTGNADFNVILYTSPWFENDERPSHGRTIEHDFHWYFRIVPRTTRMAGYEFATGYYINPKQPEEAAREYRSIVL